MVREEYIENRITASDKFIAYSLLQFASSIKAHIPIEYREELWLLTPVRRLVDPLGVSYSELKKNIVSMLEQHKEISEIMIDIAGDKAETKKILEETILRLTRAKLSIPVLEYFAKDSDSNLMSLSIGSFSFSDIVNSIGGTYKAASLFKKASSASIFHQNLEGICGKSALFTCLRNMISTLQFSDSPTVELNGRYFIEWVSDFSFPVNTSESLRPITQYSNTIFSFEDLLYMLDDLCLSNRLHEKKVNPPVTNIIDMWKTGSFIPNEFLDSTSLGIIPKSMEDVDSLTKTLSSVIVLELYKNSDMYSSILPENLIDVDFKKDRKIEHLLEVNSKSVSMGRGFICKFYSILMKILSNIRDVENSGGFCVSKNLLISYYKTMDGLEKEYRLKLLNILISRFEKLGTYIPFYNQGAFVLPLNGDISTVDFSAPQLGTKTYGNLNALQIDTPYNYDFDFTKAFRVFETPVVVPEGTYFYTKWPKYGLVPPSTKISGSLITLISDVGDFSSYSELELPLAVSRVIPYTNTILFNLCNALYPDSKFHVVNTCHDLCIILGIPFLESIKDVISTVVPSFPANVLILPRLSHFSIDMFHNEDDPNFEYVIIKDAAIRFLSLNRYYPSTKFIIEVKPLDNVKESESILKDLEIDNKKKDKYDKKRSKKTKTDEDNSANSEVDDKLIDTTN